MRDTAPESRSLVPAVASAVTLTLAGALLLSGCGVNPPNGPDGSSQETINLDLKPDTAAKIFFNSGRDFNWSKVPASVDIRGIEGRYDLQGNEGAIGLISVAVEVENGEEVSRVEWGPVDVHGGGHASDIFQNRRDGMGFPASDWFPDDQLFPVDVFEAEQFFAPDDVSGMIAAAGITDQQEGLLMFLTSRDEGLTVETSPFAVIFSQR